MVSQAVEESRGHPGVAEDGGPFAEGEVCGDDDRGALVEAADEVEKELAAGLREGQIAEFVESDEVEAGGRALWIHETAVLDHRVLRVQATQAALGLKVVFTRRSVLPSSDATCAKPSFLQ
jgi:hypothetical protein